MEKTFNEFVGEEKIKPIKEENDVLREELDKLIGLEHPLYSPIWVKINELIENELNQEKLCGE